MSRLHAIVALCVLIAAVVLPGNGVSAKGEQPEFRFTVETPTYVLDAQGLRAPGFELDKIPGAPRLPVWTTVVEVPAGADWSVMEVGAEVEILHAPASLPSAPVTELQLSGPMSSYTPEEVAAALAVKLRPDPVIYGTDAPYPARVVQAGPEGIAWGKRLLPIKVYPFQYNPVTGALHYRPRIEFSVHFTPAGKNMSAMSEIPPPAPSGNASAPGLLVRTEERGLYRLTYGALSAAGAPVDTLDPALLAVWYEGRPVDIEVTGAEDGKFDASDAVIFYAEPYVGRYMNHNVYRLTWSGVAGGRIDTRNAAPALAQPPVTTIRRRARIEYDRSYYSTYGDLARDADHFFDDPLFPNASSPVAAASYSLTLADLVPAGDAEIRVGAHGGQALNDRDPDQSLLLRLNGSAFGPYRWDGSVTHVITQTVPASSLSAGSNSLVLEASLAQLPGIPYYWVSPDWAEIVYPAQANAAANRLYVEAAIGLADEPGTGTPTPSPSPTRPPAGSRTLYLPLLLEQQAARAQSEARPIAAGSDIAAGGFTTPGIRVYDVSDAAGPVLLSGIREDISAGRYTATFAGRAGASYYLATQAGQLTPLSIKLDPGSTLRSPDNAADYIAIVHRSLWDAVQPLLDHRAAEGLRVAKVDVQDIYDEFSGSRVDPEAIRAFLSYAYHNWEPSAAPAPVCAAGGRRPL